MGLVEYSPYSLIHLTEEGRRIGRDIAHRHIIFREFFLHVLQLDETQADAVACELEHVVPPDVIWKINMFAFGGLETAFFWVLVCGLFWKRAGKWGALLSMIGGSASYCLCMALGFKVMGLHQIVIGITVAGVLMVLGSLLGRRDAAEEKRMREVFFPE